MHEIANAIVEMVQGMGYWGIFIMMFLESTFFPFPSEVAMIPAGYLAFKGEMSLVVVIMVGVMGSLAGALFNYYLAKRYGRRGVLRFGRYFFFDEVKLEKMERFFQEHGAFSTFSSRLIPGVRQFISLPAGLAKMPMVPFLLYTGAGAGIWVVILTLLGYFIGGNEALLSEYLHTIVMVTLGLIGLATVIYIGVKRHHWRD